VLAPIGGNAGGFLCLGGCLGGSARDFGKMFGSRKLA